jgi:hypothetical protein
MALGSPLERYGVFTREDFLPSSLCDLLCKAIDTAPLGDGALWSPAGSYIEEHTKRRKECSYPATDHPEVHRRIFEIAHDLSAYFGVTPKALQP